MPAIKPSRLRSKTAQPPQDQGQHSHVQPRRTRTTTNHSDHNITELRDAVEDDPSTQQAFANPDTNGKSTTPADGPQSRDPSEPEEDLIPLIALSLPLGPNVELDKRTPLLDGSVGSVFMPAPYEDIRKVLLAWFPDAGVPTRSMFQAAMGGKRTRKESDRGANNENEAPSREANEGKKESSSIPSKKRAREEEREEIELECELIRSSAQLASPLFQFMPLTECYTIVAFPPEEVAERLAEAKTVANQKKKGEQ